MAARVLHVVALSLWFGGGVFFSVSTLILFTTFERLGENPPDWLPIPADTPKAQGATLEQVARGTRLAGAAVGPIFPVYYALQGVCGVVALATAWGWVRTYPGFVNRLRFSVIALAFVMVLVGWPLVGKVESLRPARYAGDPVAVEAFRKWHLVSLALDCAALALVGLATALAARLPGDPPPAPPPATP